MKNNSKLFQRYQKLIDISRDLASTLNLDLLLDRIVNAAAELTNSEAASILLYGREEETLQFQASSNLDLAFMRGSAVPIENSIAGWIVINRSPVIIDDPQNDPRFFIDIQKKTSIPTRNLLGVPLILKDEVIGVLEAINKETGHFSKEDQDVLLILGAQAGVAIENARLFAQADLISEFVHEIRTPLSSINAAATLLLNPEIKGKHHETTKVILSESQRLNALTTEFLELARLSAGQVKFNSVKTELKVLLRECADIMHGKMNEKDIGLDWDVPTDLPAIIGDPDRLKQVFLNLLSNAVKYNKQGGTISIIAKVKSTEVIVAIKDNGIGISKENQKHLFRKFFRTADAVERASGTGLGLSIVRKIARAHGGDVLIESELGKGSVFSVHLPITPTN